MINKIGSEPCICCFHILSGKLPVQVLARPGGDWVALCSEDRRGCSESTVAHLKHVFQRDPDVASGISIPINWGISKEKNGIMSHTEFCDFTYNPVEGDIVGLCSGQLEVFCSGFVGRRSIFVAEIPQTGELVSVTLPNSLRGVPIWSDLELDRKQRLREEMQASIVELEVEAISRKLQIIGTDVIFPRFLDLEYDAAAKWGQLVSTL
jgi:hypothetical protein